MNLRRNTLSLVLMLGVAGAVAALFFSGISSATNAPPARSVSPYVNPSTVSSACRKDARRKAACKLVVTFFRAVHTGRYAAACSLLGEQLRTETGGTSCPAFIAMGLSEPMPWGVLGARLAGPDVAVLVSLGQSELDHIRMRHHLADVGLEAGRLRILDTRIVR